MSMVQSFQMHNEIVVISVGGSLIVPDEIDTDFLTQFKSFIHSHIEEGYRFAIVAGGGSLSRKYQKAANQLTPLTNEDLDWLGIHATRLNAHLLRSIFYKEAHPVLIKHPNKKFTVHEPLVIGAGWKPGRSTDYVTIRIAKALGAKKMINLSDIDYVYDSDPDNNPNAKKIEDISWKDFRKMMPKKWDPGLSTPFDPIAAKEAEKDGIEVTIINGHKLEECEKYLHAQPFVGTKIS
jgi:uridylate kinase